MLASPALARAGVGARARGRWAPGRPAPLSEGAAGVPGWRIHRSRRNPSVTGAAGTDRSRHGASAGSTARRSISRVSGSVRREVLRDVRRRAGGNGYLLGGRKSKGGSPRSPRASEEGADEEGEESPEGDENQNEKRPPATARQRMRYALRRVDSDGYWAVISSGIVFGTFLLESYNMSSFGGWDVLYREDISPWYTGLISMNALEDIEDAYNALFFFEFCLRAWAFEFKKEFWSNPVTAVDFLATIPPVLSFFEIIERGSPVFRFLRLLRVLRLLRLLDRNPDSVLFGLVRTDSMGVQLVGIGAEFVCIFVIAAGVIYDLEYTVNPNVNNLNDTLYWAILTLTGIGQPFEVVTAGGRVATVLSIAVALIVVPGQLAKLATVAGAQDLIAGMGMGEDAEDEDEDDKDDAYDSDAWEEYGTYSAAFASGAGGVVAPAGFVPAAATAPLASSDATPAAAAAPPPQNILAMRPKVWDGRECEQCGLQIHETDARFCRRCGGRLGLTESAGPLYVKRNETVEEAAKRKKKALGSRRLPFRPAAPPQGTMGRLGIDISGATMSNFRRTRNEQKSRRKGK
jgi:hypothetical protein